MIAQRGTFQGMTLSNRILFALGVVCLSALVGCNTAKHRAKADIEAYGIVARESTKVDGMPSRFSIEEEESEFWGPAIRDATRVLSLSEAIETAVRNSREYQRREEILFTQALSLSSARHQFQPRYFGEGGWDITNDDFDKTMSGFLSLGMNRMLETGTDISVGLTTNFSRIISGDDPGRVLRSALTAAVSQPLLRGSCPDIVRENLTQAEKDMVYAIRDFVRYRKGFTVQVAQDYFALLGQLDQVYNSFRNYETSRVLTKEFEARYLEGKIPPYEVDQAIQRELSGRINWIRSQESYLNSLDQFKFLLGVPVEANIQPDPAELKRLTERGILPIQIDEKVGTEFAVANRLDLKNDYERIDDARRTVRVTEDALQPLVDLFLSYQADSDGRTETFDFSDGDKLYRLGVDLELPLDTKIQRNIFRQAIVNLARAQRDYLDSSESVRLEVRRTFRRLRAFEENFVTQKNSLELAEDRTVRDRTLLNEGYAGVTVRDVNEAQDDLLAAQNSYTAVIVSHFNTTLDLFLATEALKIRDNGEWASDFAELVTTTTVPR